jgi:aminoglycoside phosphotransferase (APT) family kinase protein
MVAMAPDPDTLEPSIARVLDTIHLARATGPYHLQTLEQLRARLIQFLANRGVTDPQVDNFRRMGGGASKEQFVFDLIEIGQPARRCVLRMDPMEAAVLTSRAREFAVLRAMQGVVPVPSALWMDETGDELGRPALITGFVAGVTKPSTITSNVSGFGTVLEPAVRHQLKQPFLRHLAAIHAYDWRKLPRDLFQAPSADPQQAARWQLNWWTSVWRRDALEGVPLLGLAERWLRQNLPATRDLVVVHSDYRTGNYLFDETQLEITAILDWELVHIGDYHQDLAWIAIKSWSPIQDGVLMASGLMPLPELLDAYTAATGRPIDPKTLHFYQVLGLYQCIVICLGTSVRAAHEAHNHQDALLSWLATAGYAFMTDLIELLEAGPAL